MELNKKIRDYIMKNLIVFEEDVEFTDNDNIFKMGFVNSLFAMKLLNFVENEFNIVVENHEISIENFSSVDKITHLISSKLN